MPHTPLARMLRQAAQAALSAGIQQAESRRLIETRPPSRRQFLGQLTAATAIASLTPSTWAAKTPSSHPRVAVVGAGLAGLTCAYRLRQAGVMATVYEANTRLGGRCWTRRGDFAEGQMAEHGGELIDQGHTRIRQLAQELGLPLDNLLTAEENDSEVFFHFDGTAYPYAEAVDDLKAIWQPLHRDLSEAGYPTLYNRYTARGLALDQMSITDWISSTVPGGITSRLGQLLDVAYNIEYGAECDQQSALSLLYLLGYNSPGQFTLFGQSNEKYHIRGGNDQIVSRLASGLDSQLVTGTALVAVRRDAVGTYTLTFQSGRRTSEVVADHVVLALPFSILNASVDLTRSEFSGLKRMAIRELGMGSNSKLNVQFKSRPWLALGANGETYSDRGYQLSWDVTRGQSGRAGILNNYTGGRIADTFGSGTPAALAARFLAQIEPVLPGVSAEWNGRATVDWWAGNPFTRGSYSFWKVGQYTRFAGIEGQPEGTAHFCGEHTSQDAQGYLEGAVETGERAAQEIVDALT